MIEFKNTRESLDRIDKFFKRLDEAQCKVKEYKEIKRGKKFDEDTEANVLLRDIIGNVEKLKSNAMKDFLAEYILTIVFSEVDGKLREIVKEEIKVLGGTNAHNILHSDKVVSIFLDNLKHFPRYRKGEDGEKYTDLDVDLDVLLLYLEFKNRRNDIAHSGGKPGKVTWDDMHGEEEYSFPISLPEDFNKKIYEVGEEVVNAIAEYIRNGKNIKNKKKKKKDFSNSQDSSQD